MLVVHTTALSCGMQLGAHADTENTNLGVCQLLCVQLYLSYYRASIIHRNKQCSH